MTITWFAWTEEHVTRLREGAAAGKSAGDIAIELGVTRNTIIGKLRRMKIPLVSVLAQQRRIRTLCADDRAAIRAATSTTPRRPKMFRPKIVKLVPARVLAPAPAPKLPEVLSPGISLFDIEANQCRYPLADAVPLSDFLFCGLPTKDDKCSYCQSHWELCYERISRRNNSENVRRAAGGRMRKLLMIPAALVGVEPPCTEELPVT
jgi:GcrA cell cycle regulator